MPNFDKTVGAVVQHTRIVRAIVKEHIRKIEQDRETALASLAFIEGSALTLSSHTSNDAKLQGGAVVHHTRIARASV